VNELSWSWIVLMLIVPPAVGALAALPFWRKREMIFGNLAGATVIFGSALWLIVRESFELRRLSEQCLDAGYVCWPSPSAFTRYAIYAAIGAIEVFALFAWSLKVEAKMRNQGYAPEWRGAR